MSSETQKMKKKAKGTLTPKLRFPEFRDGEGWQTPRLSDLYGFKRTNTLSRDKLNYEIGTIRNIHYGDIHTKFKPLFHVGHECVPFINPEVSVDAFQEKDDCEQGDIVLADASEDVNDVGKAIEVVSLDGQRVVAGTHTILATRQGSVPIVGFGGHLFQSAAVRAGIQRESQGAKVYGISANRISPVALPLPPTNHEQQKIADCLSSVDELIAAEGRKLEALKAHKKGLMQQLFPRPGETRPRLRFPEFRNKAKWEVKSLGEVFDTATGGTPDRANRDYWNGTIPWVTTSLVDSNVIQRSEEFITEAGRDNSAAKMFPKGAVLIALYGQGKTRGKVAILAIDATTNQACAAIFPTEEVEPYFTFLNLAGRYNEIRSLSNSGGQDNLSQGLVRELPFSFPRNKAEQRRIAACLVSLDDSVTAQTQKLAALQTHKKGLMQQLFPSAEEADGISSGDAVTT